MIIIRTTTPRQSSVGGGSVAADAFLFASVDDRVPEQLEGYTPLGNESEGRFSTRSARISRQRAGDATAAGIALTGKCSVQSNCRL